MDGSIEIQLNKNGYSIRICLTPKLNLCYNNGKKVWVNIDSMETTNSEITYFELWKDICFFDVYSDRVDFKKYIIYLSQKYNVETKIILSEIKKVRREALEKIKNHDKVQENYPPIFKTASEEETVLYEIEYNRKRDELKLKRSIF